MEVGIEIFAYVLFGSAILYFIIAGLTFNSLRKNNNKESKV